MRRVHGCGAALVVGAALLSWYSHWIDPTALASEVSLFLITLFTMVGAYWCVCAYVLKHGAPLRVILFWAVAARVALLPGLPIYETDFYRYLWDGFVVAQCVNPYHYSPNQVLRATAAPNEAKLESNLSALCDALDARPAMLEVLRNVNNADLNTIYPPFTQLLFGATAMIAPGSAYAWRIAIMLFDAGLIACIVYLLRALQMDASRVVLYAWSPLILKEYINTTHFDVIALCGLFAVFALVQAKRLNMSSSIFACAAQSKIFPLIAFPLLSKKWRWRQWSLFAATMVLLTLLFINTGGDGMRGWSAFLQRWEANSSLVALLEWLLIRLGVPVWGGGAEIFAFSGSTYRLDAFLAAKLIAGAVWFSGWMLVALRAWRREFDTQKEIDDTFFIIALLLICSPVCNPWYLAWTVPFLCFCPRASWLYLTSACLLYYAFFTTEPSQQFLWVRVLEYCPFYALLIWERRTRTKS